MKTNPVVKSLAVLTALFMLITAVPAEVFAFDEQEPLIGSETEPAADELETSSVPEDDDHAPQPARAFEQALTAPEADGSDMTAGDNESGTAIETIPSGRYLAGADQGTDSLPFVLEDVLATTPSASGTCGTNVNWAFYESVGLLYISGTGEMTKVFSNSFYSADTPWYELISNVIITEGITSIGRRAFLACTNLKSITIPSSVTSIGNYAFYYCAGLTSITIPDSVTSIGDYAFIDCTSLTSITIPDSVTSIGDYAFKNCTGLTSVMIRANITSIVSNAFYGCSNLISITIPASVKMIGDYSFYGCRSLMNITIPVNVTNIGSNAFCGCYSLTNITLPDQLTNIGENAFYGCIGLTDITIPNSVTSIGKQAFMACYGLRNVTILNSIIGECEFSHCTGLTDITIPNSVSSIGNYAFSNCTGLTNITIPNSVSSIGNYAFRNCSSLLSVTIPDSVTNIGDYAFTNCSELTNLVIPKNVVYMGDSAFSNCWGLVNVSVLNSVISDNEFSGCSRFASVWISNDVTAIGDSAFSSCFRLTEITIPDSVSSIGNYAFSGCTSLKTISLPDSLTSIGDSAFTDCTSLMTISLPDRLTSIGDLAFNNCSGLNCIKIPKYVINIGNNAFANCSTIVIYCEVLEMPTGWESTWNPHNRPVFWGYTYSIGLEFTSNGDGTCVLSGRGICSDSAISIPPFSPDGDTVTGIGTSAFAYCRDIQSIEFPDTIDSIGKQAFLECTGLQDIRIPESVTVIGSSAFAGCSGISSIVIPDSVTSIGSGAFFGCSELESITLPFVGNTLNGTTNTHFGYIFGARGSADNETYIPTSLREVYITGGQTIAEYAFQFCVNVISIHLPQTLTTIGEFAFRGCNSITDIVIPDSVTRIGLSAFQWCKNLESITLPFIGASVDETNIYQLNLNYIFEGYQSSVSSYSLSKVTITGGKSIVADAFKNFYSLTHIELADSVTSIGKSAFYGCSSLTSISIPNNITSIADSTFYNCSSLTTISIPDNVTSIGAYAFYNCTSLSSITIPSSLTTINYQTFYGCSNLSCITIPSDVTTINSQAFYGCTNLKSVTIPESVRRIYISAFENCTSLSIVYYEGTYEQWASITIDSGNEDLLDCIVICTASNTLIRGNSSYVIPDDGSILHIAPDAFAGCSDLSLIEIPSCVESIGAGAFADCPHLYKAVIQNPDCAVDPAAFDSHTTVVKYELVGDCGATENDDVYWYVFNTGTGTETEQYYTAVVYGTGVVASDTGTRIAELLRQLDNDKVIRYLTVEDGITGIGSGAFANMSDLYRVTIGRDVVSIGDRAFAVDSAAGKLRFVYFSGNCPQTSPQAFNNANNNLSIKYNENTERWARGGRPYVRFVQGTGFVTSGTAGYKVTAGGDYTVLDSNGMDQNGVLYTVSGSGTAASAVVTAFTGGTSDIVIPETVIYAAKEYTVTSAVFDGVYGLHTLTIPASVTGLSGTLVRDCPDLEYVFFKGDIPSGFSMSGTDAFVLVVSGASRNGYTGTVFEAVPLNGSTDAQGIIYTVDPAANTAIVGRLSSGTDNAVNTSGFTGSDAVIPDFVVYHGRPYQVVGFDRNAFYHNETVGTITFGRFIGMNQTDDTPGIWDSTFRNMTNLQAIYADASNPVYRSLDGVLYTRAESYRVLDEHGEDITTVTLAIDDSILYNRLMVYPVDKTDTVYVIPDHVTVIERYAFAGNQYLTSVDLNDVTVVGSHAFFGASNLTGLGSGYQLQYIEDSAFEGTSLTSVTFTDSLVGIGARAFFGITTLSGTITLDHTISYIGDRAFARCTQLSRIDVEYDSNEYVPETYCCIDGVLCRADPVNQTLTILQYPAQKPLITQYNMSELPIVEIAPDAFYGSRYLQEIILPDSTVIVGSYAFASCAALRHVHLGKSYHGSGDGDDGLFSYGLFFGSTSLQSITVDPENADFCNDNNGALYSKDKRTLYAYPAGLTRVSYAIPAGVMRIYSLAFAENTNIKQVVVSETGDQLSIGDMVFSNCTNLEEVYYYTSHVPASGSKIYDGAAKLRTYCKFSNHAAGWAGITQWQERPVIAFDSIRPVANDSVDTDDYVLIIRDSSDRSVAGVDVFVEYTADGRQHFIQMITGQDGTITFSAKSGTIDPVIHVYLDHPDYISCDFDVILDTEMAVTYLTLYKQPTVIGISLNDKDINSQTNVLNLSAYKEKISCFIEVNGELKPSETESFVDEYGNEQTVTIRVQGLWDSDYDDPVFVLKQGDNVLADSAPGSDTAAYVSINGRVCTFTIPVRLLCAGKEPVVEMTVTNGAGDSTVSCSSVLHIPIIDFIVDSDELSVSDGPIPLDFSEGSPVLAQLIGNGRNFDLGKHLSFAISVDGSEVTLTAKAKGSKKMPGYNDYQTGYEANHQAHNKNTYFFQFYDAATKCTYNIRFARGTEEFGYYYYRLYVYNGLPGVNYESQVMAPQFGGVSVSAFGVDAGRAGLAAFAAEIYRETKKWVKTDQEEKARSARGETVEHKQDAYVPLRMTYSETGKEGAGVSSGSFSFSIEGSLVFEYLSDHSFRLKSGSLTGSVKVTAQNSTQYVVWIIPVTVDVHITVEGKVEMTVLYDSTPDGNKLSWDKLRASLSIELELSAGVGCSVASLGIYGKAGTVIVFNLFPKPASFRDSIYYWEVHGEIGLYVKVFGFKKSLRIIPWKDKQPAVLYIIDNRAARDALHTAKLASPALLNEYTMRSMLYLSGSFDAQDDCAETPRIVTVNGTEYVFYLTNVDPTGQYDACNNMKLVCAEITRDAVSGTVTVGDPVIVDDNGYVDTAFDVYTSDGTVYLALTQQTKKMDMISSEDPYALAEGLSIRAFDLSGGSAVLLTAAPAVDGHRQTPYKYLTSITEVNGIPTVVWAQNADNNIFGVSPFNEAEYVYGTDENGDACITDIISDVYSTAANSVWISRLAGGEWTTECLTDGLSAVTELSVGPDGTVYYVVDADGDLAGESDRHLFSIMPGAVPTACGSSGSVSSLTTDGTHVLYYDSAEGLVSVDGGLTLPDVTDMLSAGFRLVRDDDGHEALLYTAIKTRTAPTGLECTCAVLYGLFRTDDDTVWSSPVTVYDPDTNGMYIDDFDAVFTSGGQLLTAVSLCTDDGAGTGRELFIFDPSNTSLLCSDLTCNYAEGTVSFVVTNAGVGTQTLYVNGTAYTARSGEELTLTVEPVDGCVSVTDAEGAVIRSYTGISLLYTDLQVLTKQAVIGDTNLLVIAVRNIGNVGAENVTIYVSRDVSLTWEGMVSSVDEAGLARNAVAVLTAASIPAGQTVYYEVTLDRSMIEDGNGVMTVYAVPQLHDDETDNISTMYLGEIIQAVIGHDDMTLSTASADLILGGTDDLTVTVLGRLSHQSPIAISGLSEGVDGDYTVDTATGRITLKAAYLGTLSVGSHELTVSCEGKSLVLFLNVCDPDSVQVVRWIIPGVDGAEDEVIRTIIKDGEQPAYNGTPVREGCVFSGWQSVSSDDGILTFEAVFVEPDVTYTVTWVYLPGVTKAMTCKAGIIPENNKTTFDGQNIIGWDIDGDNTPDELTVLTGDILLTAVYEEKRLMGDINGDGQLTNVDVAMLNAYVRGQLELDEEQLACGDLIGTNGKVTTVDVARLNAIIQGIVTAD